MNCEQSPVLPADRRLLELLVDGELDEARRRELLSRLDGLPHGWKQCALAFLEAQALRAALRAPRPEAPPRPVRPRTGPSAAVRAARLASAALLLIATFCGGWLLRPADRGPHVASGQPAPPQRPADRGSGAPANAMAVETDPSAPKLHLAGVVTLQVDDGGKPVEVQVPVLAGSDGDLKRLLEKPPTIEASVIQALERRGHKIAAHRQLVAVDLEDGRRLVFPIDQVDVRFAQRVFQ